MSTHGRMVITDPHESYHLYTHADGHAQDAMLLGLTLPWVLFEAEYAAAAAGFAGNRDWVWGLGEFADEASWAGGRRTPPPQFPPGGRSASTYSLWCPGNPFGFIDRFKDKGDLAAAWQAGGWPLHLDVLDAGLLANLVAWRHLGRWLVVNDPNACAYPGDGPDVACAVAPEDGVYHVGLGAQFRDRVGDWLPRLDRLAATLNKSVAAEAAVTRDPQPLEGTCASWRVPLAALFLDMAWRAIAAARAAGTLPAATGER